MKVTVLVIAYNHVRFIRQAIDSALAQQTTVDFEILISEDCSTDGTREIVLEYAAAYSDKIRLQLSPVNLGDSRVLESVYGSIRGEYVALMDGDDYWTSPHKLQRQVEFMERHPECSICWHYREHVDTDGNPMPSQPAHSAKNLWSVEDILDECPIGASSAMLRHSMLPPFPDWLDQCPFLDRPLFVLCMQNGPGGYIDESLGAYRIHANGLYNGLDDATQKLLSQRTFRQIYRHLSPRHRALVARMYARKWATVALKQSLNGDWPAARKTAREAQQDFPHDLRLSLLAHFPGLYLRLRSVWLAWKQLWGWKVRDEV